MGEQLQSMINVTLFYPQGAPGFWDLLCGRAGEIQVLFEELPIPAQFIGHSYDQDEQYRALFQTWVNTLWTQKDATLERLKTD